MLIGIISDSHDNLNKIREAVGIFNEHKVDKVIHAGDLISPFTKKVFGELKAPMTAIYGNNDGEKEGLKKIYDIFEQPLELNIDSNKIIVVHEDYHLRNIDNSKYDVIIYGHTHNVDVRNDRKNGSLIVNPGESGGWVTGKSSVAILDLSKKKVDILDF